MSWRCKQTSSRVTTKMAHQCPARRTSCKYQSQISSETAGVGRYVEFGRTGPWLEGSSARTVDRRRKTQSYAALRGSGGEGEEEREHERGRFFPPSWACRAAWYGDTCRRNGCQYDHVNGITYTADLAAPAAAPGQLRQQQQTQQQIQQQQQ